MQILVTLVLMALAFLWIAMGGIALTMLSENKRESKAHHFLADMFVVISFFAVPTLLAIVIAMKSHH